jgi:hypothetical protein
LCRGVTHRVRGLPSRACLLGLPDRFGGPEVAERTSAGPDVRARSVAAAAIDDVVGELFQSKLTPPYDRAVTWSGMRVR